MNFNDHLKHAMGQRNIETLEARLECAKRFPALVAAFADCQLATHVHSDLFIVDFPGRSIHIVAESGGYRVRHGQLDSWRSYTTPEPLDQALARLAAHIAEKSATHVR